jgi:hypothetical protein|tara:strand:- start:184 stop:420 length:237 start_codon:yes stop_codon:yes gene_type:complete
MYIHKLGKSTSGGGGRFIRGFRSSRGTMGVCCNHKRTAGSGLKEKVFEEGIVARPTDTLRGLRLSKPRVPKKYISFSA